MKRKKEEAMIEFEDFVRMHIPDEAEDKTVKAFRQLREGHENCYIQRPNLTVICLHKELAEQEIQRQLDKPDNKYEIITDEQQVFEAPLGSKLIRKVSFYSEPKNKIKVICFI